MRRGNRAHAARRQGARTRRRLGQHFLTDDGVLRRIVAAAEAAPGDMVLEIGPGKGALTRHLLAAGARVCAVELDRSLAPALAAAVARAVDAAGGRPGAPPAGEAPFEVLWGDAVHLDWGALAARHAGPWKLCSNLPYAITGPFLAAFLQGGLAWSLAVITVQAEVAERMLAAPGRRAYGAFSCLVQYYARGELLFRVPPRAFRPPPAVDSAVVRLRPRPAPEVAAEPFLRVVRAAFAQRRKTLRNALAAGLALPPERAEAALRRAGLDPGGRAETLGLEEFAALVRALAGAALAPPPSGRPPG